LEVNKSNVKTIKPQKLIRKIEKKDCSRIGESSFALKRVESLGKAKTPGGDERRCDQGCGGVFILKRWRRREGDRGQSPENFFYVTLEQFVNFVSALTI